MLEVGINMFPNSDTLKLTIKSFVFNKPGLIESHGAVTTSRFNMSLLHSQRKWKILASISLMMLSLEVSSDKMR
jgi:hypothetical protein